MIFKEIHIGALIYKSVTECGIETSRISNFLKINELEIKKMYTSKSLDTEILLRWCKLLEYDFFRIYSQHLILYAPQGKRNYNKYSEEDRLSLPQFRKNIYTKEIIDFILEQINSKEITLKQAIERYRIPKTTLYRWVDKHKAE